MKASLTGYRAEFRDRVLDLLWRQWNMLGVAGHGAPWCGPPIDPEALLLLTCTAGRFDARLFDAMVEWVGLNGRYINVQRLKRMITTEAFVGERVVRAIAATASNSVTSAKWAMTKAAKGGENPEPLFFLKDGRRLPISRAHDPVFAEHGLLRDRYEPRGVVGRFRPEPVENLILRLRALLGVNARCEIMAYLLLNEKGSPGALARDTCYFPLTMAKAMAEMRDSGFLLSRVNGRRRDHRLVPGTWRQMLLGDRRIPWIVWPRLFRAVEVLWEFLWDGGLGDKEPLAQASSLRRVLLESVVDKTETCGLDFAWGDLSAHPGDALIPFTIDRTTALLNRMEGAGETQ